MRTAGGGISCRGDVAAAVVFSKLDVIVAVIFVGLRDLGVGRLGCALCLLLSAAPQGQDAVVECCCQLPCILRAGLQDESHTYEDTACRNTLQKSFSALGMGIAFAF